MPVRWNSEVAFFSAKVRRQAQVAAFLPWYLLTVSMDELAEFFTAKAPRNHPAEMTSSGTTPSTNSSTEKMIPGSFTVP